ncbi:MAG: hypothetical protein M3Y07_12115 [Acidobacteriota bacterium]|nr:hypothetical protein [Acidobacteriota bacterium]
MDGPAWAFRERIQKDDLVVLPLKRRSAIAIGRVTGGYTYLPGGTDDFHTGPVKWLKTDIPRSAFDQDLLYSLGAFMTVCQISRNNAETRIKAILEGKKWTPTIPLQAESGTSQPTSSNMRKTEYANTSNGSSKVTAWPAWLMEFSGQLATPLCSSEVEHRVFWRTTKSSPLTFRRNFL